MDSQQIRSRKTAPESALQVVGARANTPTTVGIHMGHWNNNYAIEICSPDINSLSYIDFTYAGQDFKGRIIYSHSANTMNFVTTGVIKLTIDANGSISTSNDLTVSTNLFVGGDSVADAHICTAPLILCW